MITIASVIQRRGSGAAVPAPFAEICVDVISTVTS